MGADEYPVVRMTAAAKELFLAPLKILRRV